jgi:hypothetical protein
MQTARAVIALARRVAGASTTPQVFTAVDRLGASALACGCVSIATPYEGALQLHHDPSTDEAIRERYPTVGIDDSSLLAEAYQHDRVVTLDIDTFEQRYPTLGRDGRTMGFSHLGAAPMHTDDGRIVGALGLGWFGASEPSPHDHVQNIADIIGNALDLATGTEQARSMASSFQSMLLPARHADVTAARAAVRYQAVDDAVGGDFYDVIRGDDQIAWLVIGDVVGHGLPAARTMGKIRFFLRAVVRTETDPAQVLIRVHDLLLTEGISQPITSMS